MEIILYAVTGIIGGLLGGMGMGGGTALIPMLGIFFGTAQKTAQAINLVGFIPMAAVTLIIHARNGLIKTKGLWIIILSGLAFCVFGSLLAKVTEGDILKRIFGGFLVILSIVQSAAVFLRKSKK